MVKCVMEGNHEWVSFRETATSTANARQSLAFSPWPSNRGLTVCTWADVCKGKLLKHMRDIGYAWCHEDGRPGSMATWLDAEHSPSSACA
eukprot:6200884-Pleurochrysis_carterae.AAC.4